jgi:hypothetical protein
MRPYEAREAGRAGLRPKGRRGPNHDRNVDMSQEDASRTAWYALTPEEVERRLDVDPTQGLSANTPLAVAEVCHPREDWPEPRSQRAGNRYEEMDHHGAAPGEAGGTCRRDQP